MQNFESFWGGDILGSVKWYGMPLKEKIQKNFFFQNLLYNTQVFS